MQKQVDVRHQMPLAWTYERRQPTSPLIVP
ncbi:hypothetical protein FG05_35173 [Fusarium graminearum]|nr:hypothetical protein FG05_35173 [Fusarium graminearum]